MRQWFNQLCFYYYIILLLNTLISIAIKKGRLDFLIQVSYIFKLIVWLIHIILGLYQNIAILIN